MGVRGFYDKYESTDETIADIKKLSQKGNYVAVDDLIINMCQYTYGKKKDAQI